MADLTGAFIKVLFLFNLSLLLIGLAITYQGYKTSNVTGSLNGERKEDLDKIVSNVTLGSKLLLVFGITISFVSFLGCCGTFIESPLILSWYLFFVILLFVFEICLLVFMYYGRDIEKDKIKNFFLDEIKNSTALDAEKKSIIEEAQSWLECCGATNANDWKIVRTDNTLPSSCCPDNKHPCKKKDSYKMGCVDKFNNWIETLQKAVLFTVILGIAFQVVIILFHCYARRKIREQQSQRN